MAKKMATHDGNSAVAHVAHMTNEVVAIYPITPSSPMAEHCDTKSAAGQTNIYGTIPVIMEMQSEAGASGAVHGALTTGALTTTFTASQGLLLMIPNMYKIAGELVPTVFHVAARAIATSALSIFGDHSDVMATRQTGFAMLASNSVQEAHDMALIAQEATIESRIPFLHFFDGFRTSHEIQKIEEMTKEEVDSFINKELVREIKARGLDPERPEIRGTSQNPDVFFQSREVANNFYTKTPAIVQNIMDRFTKLTGREYKLFDYVGAEDAEKLIILMGSGADTAHDTVKYMTSKGEKVGVLKVRLYRPFDASAFIGAIPKSVKKIAVLDRTKEPGSLGEPLYEDVRTAYGEAGINMPVIVGGRYGIGSKEFTPAMIKGVFDNLDQAEPKNHFTVGIVDDLANTSIDYDENWIIETDDVFRGVFFGLGSDGTVGANKNTIKIISAATDNYAQGYFVYDSKKAGAVTVSHVRFGKDRIRSAYLIEKAKFVAVHNFTFFEKIDMVKYAQKGGILLINSYYSADEVWNKLPKTVQKDIVAKELNVYVVDAYKIAEEIGLGSRINMIMQTAFFKISGVIDENKAIELIKDAIKKTYGKKGDDIVNMNINAVDMTLDRITKVECTAVTSDIEMPSIVPDDAPEFVKEVTSTLIKLEGDKIKTSQLPIDGTWPTGTTQYEKRNVATHIPVWNTDTCIMCNQCSLICPHAAIRPKVYDKSLLDNAPETFKSKTARIPGKKEHNFVFTLQIAPEDCTGCGLCVTNCPTKNKSIVLEPQPPIREQENKNWDYFLSLPETDVSLFKGKGSVIGSQFVKPLFEFSGACAGCGETSYVKLLTQLFGDRALIANATGCSSIYGGNLPTTPYTTREDGRGPAWNNSLFEDNAEFSLGMRLTADKFYEYGIELCERFIEDGSNAELVSILKDAVANAQQIDDDIEKQRKLVEKAKKILEGIDTENAKELLSVINHIVKKSVWAVGGDGWAYDIGYGGLDHVLASGKNVNILVLDTEVYSNTGGQASKATPKGGVAKFAAGGKPVGKKDLGLMQAMYGNVYVARISMAANPAQAIKAFKEAEAYNGPSLIIAYSHCIAHGLKSMCNGLQEQKNAVNSGHWILFRYNPELEAQGKNPMQLDSKEPTMHMKDYYKNENRFKVLMRANPERADQLIEEADRAAKTKYRLYKTIADGDFVIH